MRPHRTRGYEKVIEVEKEKEEELLSFLLLPFLLGPPCLVEYASDTSLNSTSLGFLASSSWLCKASTFCWGSSSMVASFSCFAPPATTLVVLPERLLFHPLPHDLGIHLAVPVPVDDRAPHVRYG